MPPSHICGINHVTFFLTFGKDLNPNHCLKGSLVDHFSCQIIDQIFEKKTQKYQCEVFSKEHSEISLGPFDEDSDDDEDVDKNNDDNEVVGENSDDNA